MKKMYITSAIVLALAAVLMIPFHSKADPVKEFNAEFKEVEHAIKDDNPKYAYECLDEISNKYGENDTIRGYRLLAAMSEKDIEKSISLLKDFDDKDTDEYRDLMIRMYSLGGVSYSDELMQVCLEALEKSPNDKYLLFQVGFLYAMRHEYKNSLYYLDAASKMIKDNGMADYYMGVSLFELGYEEDALGYFSSSIDKGITNDMLDDIVKYSEKVVGTDE